MAPAEPRRLLADSITEHDHYDYALPQLDHRTVTHLANDECAWWAYKVQLRNVCHDDELLWQERKHFPAHLNNGYLCRRLKHSNPIPVANPAADNALAFTCGPAKRG